jgi:hypothetical protein
VASLSTSAQRWASSLRECEGEDMPVQRSWRDCPPLDVGEAAATDRISRVAGGGDNGVVAAWKGARRETGEDGGDDTMGGRGHRSPDRIR